MVWLLVKMSPIPATAPVASASGLIVIKAVDYTQKHDLTDDLDRQIIGNYVGCGDPVHKVLFLYCNINNRLTDLM